MQPNNIRMLQIIHLWATQGTLQTILLCCWLSVGNANKGISTRYYKIKVILPSRTSSQPSVAQNYQGLTRTSSAEFVASGRASKPAEGEKHCGQRVGAFLAAASRPADSVPGCEQGVCPLWRNHHPAGHVRLPPPDIIRLPEHRQAPQWPAAPDTGGDARGETGVAGLSAIAVQRIYPEACLTRCCGRMGETCPWCLRRKGSLTRGGREEAPPPMWVGPWGVWDHISWVECWVWRGAEEGERCHHRRRHCDCTRNLYCKRICRGQTTLNRRHTEDIQLHLSPWITSIALQYVTKPSF